ncbi:MAG: polysaccharide biosynthesis tyrosine autokinase [Frankiaceae bacterium]|nr:polysaccharide biosynthesis tyrosine autokinase [Frankiaceae bacterium]MBV9870269.1 polysaccharide biosynthesis tyrosine autokinase [Frankiaceae bacterium]
MDLLGAIAILRRRWLVVVLCLIMGIAGGFDLGHRGTKQYRATAECLVNIPPSQSVQTQVLGTQLAGSLVQTYVGLINSKIVLSRASALLADRGVSVGAQGLSAKAVTNTYLIDVSATSTTPVLAQLTANAGAKALGSTVAKLQSGVPQKITVQTTSPAALPGAPVSPRPRLDLLVGLILGLLAGLGMAALLEALDRTIKSTAQADAVLGRPLVGLVPKRRAGPLVVDLTTNSPDAEPYRSARTAIRFLDPDRPLRSILVTSPSPGDGKTVTAANLAAAFALSGDHVIAIDADLRKPRLAQTFGLESAVGLTNLVLGNTDVTDALQEWGPRLSVLATGPLPPNPSEILGSQLFGQLLKDVSRRADITVIDAPPVLPVDDALSLAAQVDGVILVVRAGTTMRHSAAEAVRRLETVGANVLGYVLNAVPRSDLRGMYADYVYGSERTAEIPILTGPSRPQNGKAPSTLRRSPRTTPRADSQRASTEVTTSRTKT